MVNITNRSIVEYRITTNPANFGYDGIPSNWKSFKPDVRTSAKKILEEVYNYKNKCGYNQGLYYAEEFRLISHPEISSKEVMAMLENLQFDNMYAELNC